jgi:trans-2,3-dihydro-3-hydroxyanthranilate isomerase
VTLPATPAERNERALPAPAGQPGTTRHHLAYEIVDVFTDRPFAGNPLAVVFGGEHLDTDQMKALAREFNLSETAFVLSPTVDSASYRLRIFTPSAEIPFAGHPSVGAAVTQYRRGLIPAGDARQECGAGVLPVHVYPDGRATLTGGRATLGPAVEASPYLAAAGLTDDDRATGPDGSSAEPGTLPVRIAGTGLEFPYVPVRPDAVARAVATSVPGTPEVYVFAWDAATRVAHARLFAPGLGVPEDPATGSAALGLGVYLVGTGLLPGDGDSRYTVRQGIEIHRPSTLECVVSAVDGQAVRATVTGAVFPVARGETAVPPFVG